MLLAELAIYHSRPIAPTRRLALGVSQLPCEPAPGVGGVLLGAVAARFGSELDPDLIPELVALTHDLEADRRIPQPRLRYRFQKDLVGLTRSVHRLFRDDETGELRAAFSVDRGRPGQMALGAVYAAGQLPIDVRGDVLAAVRRGLSWPNGIGQGLFAYLSGATAGLVHADAVADPVGWALSTLGIESSGRLPARAVVQRGFRQSLIDAHPDHGAKRDVAAQRIAEIAEARRILLAS